MNIVITGASRGIGYELVKQFCSYGANAVYAVSRDGEKLEQLKKECHKMNANSKVIPLVFDISKEAEISKIISGISKEGCKIKILINNAGAILNKPFTEIEMSDMEYVYKVNVFSVVKLIQGLLPLMNEVERS